MFGEGPLCCLNKKIWGNPSSTVRQNIGPHKRPQEVQQYMPSAFNLPSPDGETISNEISHSVGRENRRNPVVAQCGARDHFLRLLGSGQYTARPLNPSEHQSSGTEGHDLTIPSKELEGQGKSDLCKCESRTTSYVSWAPSGIHLGCPIHLLTTGNSSEEAFKCIVCKNALGRSEFHCPANKRTTSFVPKRSNTEAVAPQPSSLSGQTMLDDITILSESIGGYSYRTRGKTLPSRKWNLLDINPNLDTTQHCCYTTIFTAHSTLNRVKGGEDNVLSIL